MSIKYRTCTNQEKSCCGAGSVLLVLAEERKKNAKMAPIPNNNKLAKKRRIFFLSLLLLLTKSSRVLLAPYFTKIIYCLTNLFQCSMSRGVTFHCLHCHGIERNRIFLLVEHFNMSQQGAALQNYNNELVKCS